MTAIAKKLSRLSQMGRAELTCRLDQAARTRLERLNPRSKLRNVTHACLRDALAIEGLGATAASDAPQKLLDHLRTRKAPKFFPGIGITPQEMARSGLSSAEKDRTIARADRIAAGEFDLLGFGPMRFDDPDGGLRWNYDPTTGVEAPQIHCSRINYLNPGIVGDAKVVWELNRFQFAFDLGKAYAFTGDDRYAEAYFNSFADWCAKNPPGVGVNWCSSLELAFRAVSWVWGHYFFLGCGTYNADAAWRLVRWLVIHARRIKAYLSYYTAPNTHLLGEALSLFYIGLFLPELREAEGWKRLGLEVLIGESEKQIRPDGGYFEQATYYHRYALDFYQQLIILCDLNDIELPGSLHARIEKMTEFALYAMLPNGHLPMIGDSDGGKALQLERCDPNDARPALATGAVLFDRGDFKWGAGRLREETIYLLGGEGAEAFAGIRSAPPSRTSVRYPDTGWFFLRSGWEPDANYLHFDCGPQGFAAGGHGHADMLGIEVAAAGRPIIIDPGTYTYTSSPRWRNYFRGTAAHNSATVDGLDQAEPADVFKWQRLPEYEVRASHLGDKLDFIDALHHGYRRLDDPVVHRRRVLFVKPEYWVIVDTFEAAGHHTYEITFNLAASDVQLDPETGVAATNDAGRPNCAVVPADHELEAEVTAGSEDPICGWVSYNYGARTPSSAVRYKLLGSGTRQEAFVVYPQAPGANVAVRARMLEAAAPAPAAVIEINIGGGSDYVALSGQADGTVSFNDICVHAEAAWIRVGADARPAAFRVVNGTGISWDGRELFQPDSLQEEHTG